ncbi:XRE family transcriptional regulator [Bacillus pseudomycoides]|uniref:helix-turn-helix domain-containing protein n=1 Tax=Bacillus TaxID=1386 RepID=UPI000502AB19|nr:helix-turn-helix transcriptional regulator [Bacillus pseudomycoides]KFN11972.1 helix-turn-helix family protein [Bacillus pseudomycoides]MCR8861241.1 helix-turn-helix domain-containing protein [Bacillus pseudomycoides]MDR4185599.1 helix-turn-helix transcriptional regulator [Bacillus pseudomycoides]MED0855291.1 helix-turn-helix transcriptional regulator [Bacillus pseudomycoides]MED1624785.1 helix-turn-helix transcriptional regulator [Bacillus pseudomycoides]
MIVLRSKIGNLLKNSGLKGKWVAQQLNISQNQMSNYVTGKSYPPVDKAFELAKIFGCKVDDLYEVQKENPAN